MWSRRVLRAGWMLAPILRIPVAIWNFFFGTSEAKNWTLIILFFGIVFTSCSTYSEHMHSPATAERIEKMLEGDSCMLELMPRRQRENYEGKPITNAQLSRGKDDCEQYWKDVKALKEQDAVFKKQDATFKKLGAK